MSVEKINRVLKKIKEDYIHREIEFPNYLKPFFDLPIEISIFTLSTLHEELKKENLKKSYLHKKLYDYLSEDKELYVKNIYSDKLEALLNGNN